MNCGSVAINDKPIHYKIRAFYVYTKDIYIRDDNSELYFTLERAVKQLENSLNVLRVTICSHSDLSLLTRVNNSI